MKNEHKYSNAMFDHKFTWKEICIWILNHIPFVNLTYISNLFRSDKNIELLQAFTCIKEFFLQNWGSFCNGSKGYQIGEIKIFEPDGTFSVCRFRIKSTLEFLDVSPPSFLFKKTLCK